MYVQARVGVQDMLTCRPGFSASAAIMFELCLGLPTATGTFYPDFFAELNDGRVLLAEYKGEHLVEHEQQKKNIGERWEAKSGGKALFFWAVKKDEHGRDVHRQLEDKLGKS